VNPPPDLGILEAQLPGKLAFSTGLEFSAAQPGRLARIAAELRSELIAVGGPFSSRACLS
jgi:hypothetical protein